MAQEDKEIRIDDTPVISTLRALRSPDRSSDGKLAALVEVK